MVRDRNERTPTHTRCTTIVTRTDTRNVPERIGFVERTRALALAHQMIDHILITSHNSFFFSPQLPVRRLIAAVYSFLTVLSR